MLAWVAVDRAIRLARALGLPADLDRWTALRNSIRRQVEQAGADPASGAFTQAFGSQALDAANLLLPLVPFLPPDDPRIRATVERTARELAPHGLVHRYLGADDGLPGGEASFVICSFWLVDNLALAGQTDRATALFERLLHGHSKPPADESTATPDQGSSVPGFQRRPAEDGGEGPTARRPSRAPVGAAST